MISEQLARSLASEHFGPPASDHPGVYSEAILSSIYRVQPEFFKEFSDESNAIEGITRTSDYEEYSKSSVNHAFAFTEMKHLLRPTGIYEHIDRSIAQRIGEGERLPWVNAACYIHSELAMGLLPEDQAGSFRDQMVRVGEYYPPQPHKIGGMILEWDQHMTLSVISDPHPNEMEVYNKFHYHFEAIHPFIDFNGRTGRVLRFLHQLVRYSLLLYNGHPVNPEQHFDYIKFSDRQRYYELLRDFENNSPIFLEERLYSLVEKMKIINWKTL